MGTIYPRVDCSFITLTLFLTRIPLIPQKEIVNYFKDRQNSGFVEGINNKIKLTKRRCYGLFDPKSFFQRLVLDLSGYRLLGAACA